jgi:hypothetical protein
VAAAKSVELKENRWFQLNGLFADARKLHSACLIQWFRIGFGAEELTTIWEW